MTSSVRFFGLKAIAVSAALSMTAGLAFAGDNTISKNSIVDALKTPPVTRSLSGAANNGPDAATKAREASILNKVRNRQTRSLSISERQDIAEIAANKPKIDLEINFDYDSASISASSMQAVQHLGEALSDPQLKGSTFAVSGYTDAKGGYAYNQELSERRADTIKKLLVENYDIAAGDLITVDYGKTHLKDPANPEDGVNRRVQVTNTEVHNTAQN
jgi:outer membrane protein OmpA-like peptidoglycan-associated protein